MKNVFQLMFVAMLMAFMPSEYSQGQSLLLEEGFETQRSGAPEGWEKGAKVDGVKYVYDKKISKSGKRSLGFEKSVQRYYPIAGWSRKVKHNSELGAMKISAQVKAENAGKAVIEIAFLDKGRNQISKDWVAYIGAKKDADPPADHDWKEYSGEIEIPVNTDRILFSLQMYGPGKVWFDDLEATYVEQKAKEPVAPLENQVEVKVGDSVGHYLTVPARKENVKDGCGLLIVLPGGDGSADFHPFVSRIHENALGGDFVLAQPLAKMWTKGQQIVWPTSGLKVDKMKYTTEELCEAVIADVGSKVKLNPTRIYILAWSSGGPAAYAALLKESSPISGGFLAMSVFKPNFLPDLKNGKDKSFYVYHSKEDRVCPCWMAKKGFDALTEAKARTKMVEYSGGHGWHGSIFGNISSGIQWLESK